MFLAIRWCTAARSGEEGGKPTGAGAVLEEQPPLSFAIPACLTGPDGITSLPKNNQTEPISQRNTTQRHRGQETGNVNALPKPRESRGGRGSMQAPGWVPLLSALLLAREGNGEWPSEPHCRGGPWARCWQGWPGGDTHSWPWGEGTCGNSLAAACGCASSQPRLALFSSLLLGCKPAPWRLDLTLKRVGNWCLYSGSPGVLGLILIVSCTFLTPHPPYQPYAMS